MLRRGLVACVVNGVVYLAAGLSIAQVRRSNLADAGYADSKVCATCHSSIAASYRRTGMGRSFYRPRPENRIEDYTNQNAYYHRPSDSYFTMTVREGRYFQRRYQIDINGKQTNAEETEYRLRPGVGKPREDLPASHQSKYAGGVAAGLVCGKRRLLGDEPGI